MDYRNKTGGKWEDVLIWEEWTVNGWAQATSVPKTIQGNIYISGGVDILETTNISATTVVLEGGYLNIHPYTFTFSSDLFFKSGGSSITGEGTMYVMGTFYCKGGQLNIKTIAVSSIMSQATSQLQMDLTVKDLYTPNCTITGRGSMKLGKFTTTNLVINLPLETDDFLFYRAGGSDSVIVAGALSVSGAGKLRSFCPIFNNGTINIGARAEFLWAGGLPGLYNNGTVKVQNPASLLVSVRSGPGSEFTGDGQLVITDVLYLASNQSFSSSLALEFRTLNVDGPGDLILNSDFVYDNGGTNTIGGTGILIANENFLWKMGDISRKFTNTKTLNIIIGDYYYKNIACDSLINNGTMNISSGNTFTIKKYFENNILLNINNSADLTFNGYGSITNNGSIFKISTGNLTIGNQVTNKGTLSVAGGILQTYLGFENYGVLSASGPGVYQGSLTLHPGGSLAGDGTIVNNGNWQLNIPLIIPASLTFKNSANVYGDMPLTVNGNFEMALSPYSGTGFTSISVTGKAVWKTGTMNVPVNIQPGGILEVTGIAQPITNTITNNGTLRITPTSNLVLSSSANLLNNGTVELVGAGSKFEITTPGGYTNTGNFIKKNAGTATIKGMFINKGPFSVSEGELKFVN